MLSPFLFFSILIDYFTWAKNVSHTVKHIWFRFCQLFNIFHFLSILSSFLLNAIGLRFLSHTYKIPTSNFKKEIKGTAFCFWKRKELCFLSATVVLPFAVLAWQFATHLHNENEEKKRKEKKRKKKRVEYVWIFWPHHNFGK